jgi:isopentenyl diphosphate isomerase/L-lactate dehydrogenase-like FMN-dependent dehydrogenase
MDSGVRRGGDIVKALVCGAKAVLVGRAPLYGVSVAGQEGVERALGLLSTEMEKTMAFLGATSVAALNRDMIFSK